VEFREKAALESGSLFFPRTNSQRKPTKPASALDLIRKKKTQSTTRTINPEDRTVD
jgi:hypothetical protein